MPPAGQDEIGDLAGKLAVMQGGLRRLITGMRANVGTLNSSAAELSASAHASARVILGGATSALGGIVGLLGLILVAFWAYGSPQGHRASARQDAGFRQQCRCHRIPSQGCQSVQV